MKNLTQNITRIFGKKGKLWLANLPLAVKALSDHWHLSKLTPVDNMTFNYVAKAVTHSNQPLVLKISCDEQLIQDEKQALAYFNGAGSIQLIDHNAEYNALLLQKAMPGTTLKSLYPTESEFVIDCYATVVQKLHHKPLAADHHYQHIRDWLQSIDRAKSNQLPKHLLKRAIQLKNALLASSTQQLFLHGDLHLDNVLKNGNTWLAIDPKGIVGEPEFEIAAFDFIHPTELDNKLDVRSLLDSRITYISQRTGLNAQRIRDWVFVRLILSAAWGIEDKGDPSTAIKLVDSLF
jgi:streptomycin 6-kinase